jgi:protease II
MSRDDPPDYPTTRQADVVDDYFGTKVKDPYRWLEDDNSPETKAWVEAQNAVTFAFLESIPERAAIRERLTELWDYERYGLPSREGPWYVFSRNDGLQKDGLHRRRSLPGLGHLLRRLRLADVAGARGGDREGPAGPRRVVQVLERRLEEGWLGLLL